MSLKNVEKRKEYNRLYFQKNKDKIYIKHQKWLDRNKKQQKEYHKNYQIKYYLKNKEKIDLKNKIYAKAHPERMVKTVQRYVANHKEKVKEYRQQYEKGIAGRYRLLVYRAKKFNGGTDITIDQFKNIISQPCYYCGEKEKPRGIDRVDNRMGYLFKNSVPCCKLCNFMKKTLTKEEFLKHIEKIYKYQRK